MLTAKKASKRSSSINPTDGPGFHRRLLRRLQDATNPSMKRWIDTELWVDERSLIRWTRQLQVGKRREMGYRLLGRGC